MDKPSINSFQSVQDLVDGVVLVIDKPYEWTSFDVVNKIKWFGLRHLKIRKFKIGHAGTLDPLATGMLVVCTGKKTKTIDQLQGGVKEYTGTIFLGKTTKSYDLETEPEGEFSIDHLNEELLKNAAKSFVGEQLQRPPAFSAKWVDGKRAYEAARRGEEVTIPKASITIFDFELTRIELPEVDFRIVCSKGTYIRSIANDFGERLNTGSYLKSLRRVGSKPFTEADMLTMDAVQAMLDGVFKNITSGNTEL